MNLKKIISLLLGPLSYLFIVFLARPEALSEAGIQTAGIALWISIWWITEAIPIAATALLPLVLLPLTGVMSIEVVGSGYSNKMIFLFLGGFIIAAAIQKTGLHKRIALNIIYRIGTNWNKVILGFMSAAAFLSMWISNTATAVMMLPIGLAVVSQLKIEGSIKTKMAQTLMLAIAYGCSVGGIATLIGTPTNPIFAAYAEQAYGITIAFNDWLIIGLPFTMIMLLIAWVYLTKVMSPSQVSNIPGGREMIKQELGTLGKMQTDERSVFFVFVSVAILWIFRKPLISPLLSGTSDTTVALIGALVLFIIPSKHRGRSILNWKTAESIPWGILLLFGGGLALASSFKISGLAQWIGEQMSAFGYMPLFFMLLALFTVVNFLTEITSNVATAAMLMPVLGALALQIDIHPFGVMVGSTIASSCAFMLPVATPPNAVVFGSGYLSIPVMIKAGIWMNLLSIVFTTLLIYILLPVIWGIDLESFPVDFGPCSVHP